MQRARSRMSAGGKAARPVHGSAEGWRGPNALPTVAAGLHALLPAPKGGDEVTRNLIAERIAVEKLQVAARAVLANYPALRLNNAKVETFWRSELKAMVVNLRGFIAGGCPEVVSVHVEVPTNAWQHLKQHVADALAWLDGAATRSTSSGTLGILRMRWRGRLRVRRRVVREERRILKRVCPHADLQPGDPVHLMWTADVAGSPRPRDEAGDG